MLGLTVLDLYQHSSNAAERFEPARIGLDHLASVAESLEELEAWARWLDAQGIVRSDVRHGDGNALLDFTDPHGIQIEFAYIDPQLLRRAHAFLNEQDGTGTR
jgi:glyoxylase I family protein